MVSINNIIIMVILTASEMVLITFLDPFIDALPSIDNWHRVHDLSYMPHWEICGILALTRHDIFDTFTSSFFVIV